MQQFKIREDGFKEIRKQALTRSVPISLLAVSAGIFISQRNTPQSEDVNVLPFIIPIALCSVGYGVFVGIKRQKTLFDSYTLTITDTEIKREQFNTPAISIPLGEIKEIVKNKNNSFTIKGTSPQDIIGIPAQIERHEDLEIILQSIDPIVVKQQVTFLERYQGFAGLLTIGLMLCVYVAQNKVVVALSGTALTIFLGWSLYAVQRNKSVDNKTRKSMWLVLLPMISVIVMTILKVTGMWQQP